MDVSYRTYWLLIVASAVVAVGRECHQHWADDASNCSSRPVASLYGFVRRLASSDARNGFAADSPSSVGFALDSVHTDDLGWLKCDLEWLVHQCDGAVAMSSSVLVKLDDPAAKATAMD